MIYLQIFAVVFFSALSFFVNAHQGSEHSHVETIAIWLMMLGILLATIGCALNRGGRPPAKRVVTQPKIAFGAFSLLTKREVVR